MVKEKLKTQLWAIVIAFLAGFGGIGCVVTAMRMGSVHMGWIAGACAASAVVFSLCFRRKLGWVPLCLFALLGGYLWQKGPLEQSMEGVIFHITALYDTGYGWGAVRWTELDPSLAELTPALCVLGMLVTAAMAWTVASRRTAWLGITAGCLPLAICLVLTNTVPDETYLYLLLTALMLVILTQSMRRRDEKKGNTLTAMAVIPVAAVMALLLLIFPQDTYQGQKGAEQIEEFVMELLGLEKESTVDIGAVGDYSENTVDLTTVGPKTYQTGKVMTVLDTQGGLLYLRGCAYDIYDGYTWNRSEEKWERDGIYSVAGEPWKVTVSTAKPHDVLYMPNVVASKLQSFQRGRLENPEGKLEYQFLCTETLNSGSLLFGMDSNLLFSSTLGAAPNAESMEQYLQLPEQTGWQARQWLEENVGPVPENVFGEALWLYVCEAMEKVKASATYDLQADRMPDEEADFALWFLEESETGYCVHFATAATVLLRSMGIPARYVTGYLVNTRANESITVRLKDAHAWVEVYDSLSGWITLDPTPAGFGSPVPPPEVENTQPSDETTLPEETTESTAPEPTTEVTTGQTEPSETVAVIGGVDAPDTPSEDGGAALLWLLPVIAVVAAAIGQWQLRVWLRRKKQHTGTANEQALARWQEVELHEKLRGKRPEELEALAQKAKYSQHMLTRQELRQFEVYLIHSRKVLRCASWWRRLYYTLILALY